MRNRTSDGGFDHALLRRSAASARFLSFAFGRLDELLGVFLRQYSPGDQSLDQIQRETLGRSRLRLRARIGVGCRSGFENRLGIDGSSAGRRRLGGREQGKRRGKHNRFRSRQWQGG